MSVWVSGILKKSMLHHLQFFVDNNMQAVLVRPKPDNAQHLVCCKDNVPAVHWAFEVFGSFRATD